MARVSLPGVQALVGLTAGLISIVGGTYSALQLFSPAPSLGEVVAVVRDGHTDKPVPDATVEILTLEDALVTTLTPRGGGRAHAALREGVYRLRVSHPRFGAEVRQIQVVPGQTAEVRIQLAPRAGGASPVDQAKRAVDQGLGTLQRLFRELTR